MKKKIVIFSDCTDIAYNEVFQVLSQGLDEYNVKDFEIAPLVAIRNFSVVHAAFSVRLLSEVYGRGAIFVVIVNGSKSDQARIFGETNHGLTFVGSNLGYFNWMIQNFGLKRLYRNKIDRKIDGRSFGGKYVQTPTAIKLAAGIDCNELGEEVDASFLIDYTIPEGSVLHCDNFGLMKIKAPSPTNLKEGDRLEVLINGRFALEANYTENMKRWPDGSWTLFKGSSLYGLPELGRVRSLNSAEEIKVREGDIVSWKKI